MTLLQKGDTCQGEEDPRRILRIAKEVLKIFNVNLPNLPAFLCGLRGEKGFCSRLKNVSGKSALTNPHSPAILAPVKLTFTVAFDGSLF